MPAKSAPQLASTSRRISRRPRHLPATLVVLALCAFVAGAGWLVDPQPLEPVGAVAEGATEIAAPPEALAEPPRPQPAALEEDRRIVALSEFLARRYKVSRSVTLDLVSIAHAAGHQMGLDPLLIIAVMAVESSFNPIAESVAGAKGLMQVIPKYHGEKLRDFGGDQAVFDPETNILVGAQILKEYLGRTGNLTTALQMYAGALRDANVVYTGRVLTEKERLQQVVRSASPQRQRRDA